MTEAEQPTGLRPLLDKIGKAGDGGDALSVDDLLRVLGPGSFGPLMLLPALFVISPFSALVGFDSVMGVLIALIAAQMLFGRDHVWLPERLLRVEVGQEALRRIVRFLNPVAGWTDRIVRPRMQGLARGLFSRFVAALCVLIGATMPPLEAIPFSNTVGAGVVSLISLGITVHDGLVIALALALAGAAAVALAFYALS